MKELSKREGISDSEICKHFKDKNDLILQMLEYYNHFYIEIYDLIETSELSVSDAIQLCISKVLAIYEEHPNITAILNNYENFRYDVEISDRLTGIVYGMYDFLTRLFQKGIDSKELSGKLSADSSAYLLMGTFLSVSLSWRITKHQFALTDKFRKIHREIDSLLV